MQLRRLVDRPATDPVCGEATAAASATSSAPMLRAWTQQSTNTVTLASSAQSVAGTRNGTITLRDGMRVRVDGTTGRVEILQGAPTS